MKEIVVLSGKGGTGKTSILACFAALADGKVLCDCDVDAPDLHLLLQPQIKETHEFEGLKVAHIDRELCTECGICAAYCRSDAIRNLEVDPLACEGCGLCVHVCPFGAISMRDRTAGDWHISDSKYGPLVHARLRAGEENSGKLVALVREKARGLAETAGVDLVLSDGPPGIGCPVISSLSGASLAMVVTEPSLSGIHDLERILTLCRHFGVRALVCINKCDLSEENSQRIERECAAAGVEVISRIPFDPAAGEAVSRGVPLVELSDGPAAREVRALWERLKVE
jgi:MinD superfamily P-loop ATPase